LAVAETVASIVAPLQLLELQIPEAVAAVATMPLVEQAALAL